MMKNLGVSINIGLIEDNIELLKNYTEYFLYQEDYEVSFSYSSINEFLENQDNIKVIPQIILLDINMPGISGIDGIYYLKKKFPNVTIVVLSAYSQREYILKALENGANGYLIKGVSLNEIKKSLENYNKQGYSISPKVAKQLVEEFRQAKVLEKEVLVMLTKRENEVVKCIVDGLTQQQSATHLGIKFHTVNHHLKSIYVKLNVKNRSSLIKKILTKM
jgi:DNA-binding NarL/FixJ family response regulator